MSETATDGNEQGVLIDADWFEAHGFETEWDGSASHRVEVIL
jgi:hypothetical protein